MNHFSDVSLFFIYIYKLHIDKCRRNKYMTCKYSEATAWRHIL